MADNISVTQGSGTLLTTDQCSGDGSHMEVVKLAYSAAGARTLIQGDVNGLLVNVSQVQGTVTVAGAVTISGTPAVTVTGVVSITGTPAVTVTSGSVTLTGSPAVTISGTPAVTVSGSVAVTQSGGWNIGTVATITNPVTVTGAVSITGTATVGGTVTVNQGTPAAIGNAWYVQLSDGTHANSFTNFSGSYALNVNVLGQVGGGVSQADTTNFTAGTTPGTPIEGVFNDGLTAVGSGKAALVRMTAYRGQHVNLRDSAGNELGLVGDPLYVQVTGGIQPVSGTVTANQGGAPWSFNQTEINGSAVIVAAAGVQTVAIVGGGGTAFSQVNPLQTQNAPSGNTGGATQTTWKNHLVISPSQTAAVVHTAAGGKTSYIEGYTIYFSASGTTFTLFDNTNTPTTTLYASGSPPAFLSVVVCPARPIPLSATGNSLAYTTGASVAGDITVWGYDA
ncbi:MAG TPA: hypothetical protein VK752_05190 [Bryobacteraceae bacterium]|jgi:hypothetical protein|nr:hypothetical protein [Bryobacteraceae bacterium]